MVTCSHCKEDLDVSKFSKSQRRKGPKFRKCKDCINKKTKQKKDVINTENTIMNYYQNLIMKSNEFMRHQIALVIVEYLINKHMTLNGMYEHMDVKEFEAMKTRMGQEHFEMYNKLVQLNGTTLILNKNLTFKWIICNNITHYYLDDRCTINRHNEYPYKIYEGFYKVYNNKKLSFELLGNDGRSIKMDGELVYETTDSMSIKVRNCKNLMDRGMNQILLQQTQRENCKLLKYIKHKKEYEP